MSVLDDAKAILANCDSLQDLFEADDATEAADSIFLFGVKAKDTQRPFGLVSQTTKSKARAGTNNFFCSGTIEFRLEIDEIDLAGDTYEENYDAAWEIADGVLDDLTELAGTAGYMDLSSITVNQVEQSAWNEKEKFWSIKITMEYP